MYMALTAVEDESCKETLNIPCILVLKDTSTLKHIYAYVSKISMHIICVSMHVF